MNHDNKLYVVLVNGWKINAAQWKEFLFCEPFAVNSGHRWFTIELFGFMLLFLYA